MKTLVLLHGWGATGGAWQRQVAAFGEECRVLAPTLPSWEAGWVADCLADLPLKGTVAVGWSLGGMLLLQALAKSGLQPAGVVLAGVPARFCRAADHPYGQPPAAVRAMRRALHHDAAGVLGAFAARCLAAGEEAYQEEAAGLFHAAEADILAAGLDFLLNQDLGPLLPRIASNPVIVQGGADEIVPPDQGRALAQYLPGSRLIVLPGAGHLPFVTQAAEFNEILRDILRGGPES